MITVIHSVLVMLNLVPGPGTVFMQTRNMIALAAFLNGQQTQTMKKV